MGRVLERSWDEPHRFGRGVGVMEAQDTLRQCPDCGGNLMQVTSCKWIPNLNEVEYEDVKHTYYCGKCEADKSAPPASEEG